ncbi:MAG TPA: hypothetical protein VGM51_18575 [Armatimonadota bacterium]|jgi:hypothetical protein
MAVERRAKSPRRVAGVIGLFFLAYGAYARWFTADQHTLYAVASWALGLVWLILAIMWSDSDRP